ncbi:MAG: protein-disulfide reductase DsbD domain-containing protein [Cyclobacteriaceae bacterium]
MNCLPQISSLIICISVFLQGSILAQVQERRFVELKDEPEFTISPGEEKQLTISFLIKDGYHIQANRVNDENLIPSVLTFEASEEVIIGDPVYPKPDEFKMEGVEEALPVFGEILEIKVPVRTANPVEKGTFLIQGKLYYQPCDASKCYYPRELDFRMKIAIR